MFETRRVCSVWMQSWLLATTFITLAACSDPVVLRSRHQPLFSPAAHDSVVWAEAESSRGVRRIEIVSTRGDLEACGTPNASWNAIPCRTNISKVTYACDFPASPRSARCESRRFLSVASLVTYSATVTDASGRKDTTEPITNSGGPFSGNVFARPVYWHTNFPTNPPPRETIDIGYFPDPDYGSAYGTFADDVGNSVSDRCRHPLQRFEVAAHQHLLALPANVQRLGGPLRRGRVSIDNRHVRYAVRRQHNGGARGDGRQLRSASDGLPGLRDVHHVWCRRCDGVG